MQCPFRPGWTAGHKKSLRLKMTTGSGKPKMDAGNYSGCIFIPNTAAFAVF